MPSHNEKPCYPSTWATHWCASNVLLFLVANSVGQIQDKEKGFWTTGFHYSFLRVQCIHHKLKSQISYDNVLLLGIVFHRKVFPSWGHLSNILGPRIVRTKFFPKNKIVRHPPLGYFIAQHLPPLQSWSRPATCWAGKYPPSWRKTPRTPMDVCNYFVTT